MTLHIVRKWPQWWSKCSFVWRCQLHDSLGGVHQFLPHTPLVRCSERVTRAKCVTPGHGRPAAGPSPSADIENLGVLPLPLSPLPHPTPNSSTNERALFNSGNFASTSARPGVENWKAHRFLMGQRKTGSTGSRIRLIPALALKIIRASCNAGLPGLSRGSVYSQHCRTWTARCWTGRSPTDFEGGQPANKSLHVSEHSGLKIGLTLVLWLQGHNPA